MNDCSNAEIRDLLCDAVHGTLAGDARHRVDAHVASCADCSAELALLHRARAVLARSTPRVDVARIASAIPPRRARSRALSFSTWRVAATIAVMAVGAASLSLARRQAENASGAGTGESAVASADAHTLSFSGRLSTLDDADLEQLLADLDAFDGGTSAEPAAVLPVPAWEGGTP
jgi:anti-sigma factor RsiW